ncbi:MAG: hypothetical protein JST54_24300 [Deltaproteobacteria bacterium]|nr:hypothetical protein [Deltaproteobacteria bacterium]
MRLERHIGRAERTLRWAMLAFSAVPLATQLWLRFAWQARHAENPGPTQFVLDGWSTVLSLVVLVAAVCALGPLQRRRTRIAGELAAAALLGVVALGSVAGARNSDWLYVAWGRELDAKLFSIGADEPEECWGNTADVDHRVQDHVRFAFDLARGLGRIGLVNVTMELDQQPAAKPSEASANGIPFELHAPWGLETYELPAKSVVPGANVIEIRVPDRSPWRICGPRLEVAPCPALPIEQLLAEATAAESKGDRCAEFKNVGEERPDCAYREYRKAHLYFTCVDTTSDDARDRAAITGAKLRDARLELAAECASLTLKAIRAAGNQEWAVADGYYRRAQEQMPVEYFPCRNALEAIMERAPAGHR